MPLKLRTPSTTLPTTKPPVTLTASLDDSPPTIVSVLDSSKLQSAPTPTMRLLTVRVIPFTFMGTLSNWLAGRESYHAVPCVLRRSSQTESPSRMDGRVAHTGHYAQRARVLP